MSNEQQPSADLPPRSISPTNVAREYDRSHHAMLEPASGYEPRSSGISYFLLAVPALFGMAGLHRFYLNRPLSGMMYLLTWGFFGIGTLVDLFFIPRMVEEENIRLQYRARRLGWLPPHAPPLSHAEPLPLAAPAKPAETEEQAILRMARENDARVTATMVAVETGISLRRAKRKLEALCKEGYAERDVSSEGATLYIFPGLLSNKPFDIDEI